MLHHHLQQGAIVAPGGDVVDDAGARRDRGRRRHGVHRVDRERHVRVAARQRLEHGNDSPTLDVGRHRARAGPRRLAAHIEYGRATLEQCVRVAQRGVDRQELAAVRK